jgi:hypothetical protein
MTNSKSLLDIKHNEEKIDHPAPATERIKIDEKKLVHKKFLN